MKPMRGACPFLSLERNIVLVGNQFEEEREEGEEELAGEAVDIAGNLDDVLQLPRERAERTAF